MAKEMSFVLAHGGWCGGWVWDDLRPLLEVEGLHIPKADTHKCQAVRQHF